jgi:hypothetical protein
MSTVAVIVVVVAAILLLALLIVGLRRASRRHPSGDAPDPYRSHAEASRHRHTP